MTRPVVPLHGDWWTWSDPAVRSAGFPVHDLVAFGAPALACAADATDVTDDDFAAHYAEETGRSLATLARTVGTDLFREAMLWQNRRLVPLILDTFLETPDWAARRSAGGAGSRTRSSTMYRATMRRTSRSGSSARSAGPVAR